MIDIRVDNKLQVEALINSRVSVNGKASKTSKKLEKLELSPYQGKFYLTHRLALISKGVFKDLPIKL